MRKYKFVKIEQRGVGEEVVKWKKEWESSEDREEEEQEEQDKTEEEKEKEEEQQERNRQKLREDELLCQRYIRR